MRRRKRKSNIIMTLTLISALILISALPLPVAEAANFTVSKSNISLENGESSTITIKAPTHTGRLDITSSNAGVATASESSLWVENDSKTITISAKSVGTVVITIKGELYDASAEAEDVFTRTINVTVTKASSSNSNNSGNTSGGNTSGSTGGNQSSGSTGGTTGSTNGSQTGSSSNNNQSSNSGTSSSGGNSSSGSSSNGSTSGSGGQNSSSTSKPSLNGTSSSSSSKPATSTQPDNSFSDTTQNNTTVRDPLEEESMPIGENIDEEIINEENLEEIVSEEEVQESQNIELETSESAQKYDAEEEPFKGNFIIIAGVAIIAVAVTGIGIAINKKILKK